MHQIYVPGKSRRINYLRPRSLIGDGNTHHLKGNGDMWVELLARAEVREGTSQSGGVGQGWREGKHWGCKASDAEKE